MRYYTLPILILTPALLVGCSSFFDDSHRMNVMNDDFGDLSSPISGSRWSDHGAPSYVPDIAPAVGRSPASEGSAFGSSPRDMQSYEGMSNPQDTSPPDFVDDHQSKYKHGSRATRADFIDESTNEGSLWASDGQTNYYFTKNKVRGTGDILSLTMGSILIRDIQAEIKRNLSQKEMVIELSAAQQKLRAKALGLVTDDQDKKGKEGSGATTAAAAAAAPGQAPLLVEGIPAAEPKTQARPKITPEELNRIQASINDVDLSKTLELKENDTIIAEIIQRYPNGNYKVRGTKRIPYKNGLPKQVTVVGIAKAADISEEDVINSGKLYEYRVEAER